MFWGGSCFYKSTVFIFLVYMKSFYESCWSFSTLFLIYLFKHIFWHQLFPATATVVTPVGSDNGQSFLVLFLVLMHSYNYGAAYIKLTFFILSIFCSNKISTCFVAITEQKVIFLVLEKKHSTIQLFIIFHQHNIVVWILLTI